MDKYVGHFIDTAVIKGNVCLGAHNRGYPVNYFQNIKSLEEGECENGKSNWFSYGSRCRWQNEI